jgi:hypothetical protein
MYRALRDAAGDSADVFAFTFLRELNVSVDNQAVVLERAARRRRQ